MKLKSIKELKDGMWCRLASGEVYTYHSIRVDDTSGYPVAGERGYIQALIDMGAEWYPKIPDGYRLATEEDRKGPKPRGYMLAYEGRWHTGYGYGTAVDPWAMDWSQFPECIVPIKQEPKLYTVQVGDPLEFRFVLLNRNDFQPGDRVRVEKVEG